MNFLTSKHPDAAPWFIIDWSSYVLSIGSPNIVTSVWIEVSSTGITVSDDTVVDLQTKARIVGGTDGEKHYLENKVTFSDLSSDVASFTIVVADGVPDL